MAKRDPKAIPMKQLDWVRKQFLAGGTVVGIRQIDPDLPVKALKSFRDELFADLRANPAKVKALACGEVLNANEIVKFRDPRPRARNDVEQVEMFPGAVLA